MSAVEEAVARVREYARDGMALPDELKYDLLLLANEAAAPSRTTQTVGAELRSQADKFESYADASLSVMHYTYAGVAADLRARAEEVDPGGGAGDDD